MEWPDLFARRSRLRIIGLIILATVVYWMAVCAATVATGLIVIFWLISQGGVPDSFEVVKWFGLFCLAVLARSIVIGSLMSLVRLPTLRRKLEAQVLRETGAQLANPDAYPEIRNVLDGLALSAGVPAPRFAVIQDVTPNSFGVGTRPEQTIIGITSGLADDLTRDELEAVLSYEVSRIGSWDIALAPPPPPPGGGWPRRVPRQLRRPRAQPTSVGRRASISTRTSVKPARSRRSAFSSASRRASASVAPLNRGWMASATRPPGRSRVATASSVASMSFQNWAVLAA